MLSIILSSFNLILWWMKIFTKINQPVIQLVVF